MLEDDEPLRRSLGVSLRANGFAVFEAGDGEEALRLLTRQPIELALLDVNLGAGITGVEVCGRIRELQPMVGVVMVTVRDSEDDKVAALEAGADDFVTKPFRIRELVARIRAVLRRLQAATEASGGVIEAGPFHIDPKRRVVTKNGTEVRLTPTEFNVLLELGRAGGAPIAHRELLRRVWGPECKGELEYLRAYIRLLRMKLEETPGQPRFILTEPHYGYKLAM